MGAYLASRHDVAAGTASGRHVIAVDGKAIKGSARLNAPRRHLLSAVTHHRAATLAQAEVGAKTNETAHFQPLLEPLDLAGTLVTFDALHSVRANVTWLVETKNAHYIAVIKANQPTAHRQLAALPWRDIPVQRSTTSTGHGRHESRSIKTCARHRALDHLRRQKRRPRTSPIEPDALELPGQADTAGAALETASTRWAVAQIAGLPPDQAEAVMLRVVVGLDGPAAARVLGKRPGAVRTAAHRGLKRLAEQLATQSGRGTR